MGKIKKFYKALLLSDGTILDDIEHKFKEKIIETIRENKRITKISNRKFYITQKNFKGYKFYVISSDRPIRMNSPDIFKEISELLYYYYLKEKNEFHKKIELLSKAGEFFSSALEIENIIKNIICEVKKILNVERVSIFKVEEDKKKISFFSFTDGEGILKSVEVEWGRGIVGYVAKKKKPLIVNDVSKDSRFHSQIDKITGFKTRNILAYPLIVQKKIIGIIEALNKKKGEFDKSDLELVSLIS